MKKLLIAALTITLYLPFNLQAQILHPVKWSYAAKKINNKEAVVFLKATIDDGWHVYSQTVKEGGPIKTSFNFNPSPHYSLIGNTIEPTPITKNEPVFNMEVGYFEKSVVFQQKIKLKGGKAVVKGTLNFMTCNDRQCLPPEDVDFNIPIK